MYVQPEHGQPVISDVSSGVMLLLLAAAETAAGGSEE